MVQVCGKDASGCRLAFDLGKSSSAQRTKKALICLDLALKLAGDIKTVAVKDNEVVYSKETEWAVA